MMGVQLEWRWPGPSAWHFACPDHTLRSRMGSGPFSFRLLTRYRLL